MVARDTIQIEDAMMAPFFNKQGLSIERGQGVYVFDEDGKRYLDFTAGWGVTCIGHAHPVITAALQAQAGRIIQNPNSGLSYSPARAQLLTTLREVLPVHLSHVFFTNSGAEANDAAIKLARKITDRPVIVATYGSFHGRTISTASATGQAKHKDRYNVLMPGYRFVGFDDLSGMQKALDDTVAAVIVEPIQGEGGVRVPSDGYLAGVESLCRENGSLLIMDEIQTGFCRTGPMFVSGDQGVTADFVTMAKALGGGFPIGAFAMSKTIVPSIQVGDHGGTYCGNPLGCAVANAVVRHLIDINAADRVAQLGAWLMQDLRRLKEACPESVVDVRGKGLLLLVEFKSEALAAQVARACMAAGLLVTQTNGSGIRIFPALTIKKDELQEGLAILDRVIEAI